MRIIETSRVDKLIVSLLTKRGTNNGASWAVLGRMQVRLDEALEKC